MEPGPGGHRQLVGQRDILGLVLQGRHGDDVDRAVEDEVGEVPIGEVADAALVLELVLLQLGAEREVQAVALLLAAGLAEGRVQ